MLAADVNPNDFKTGNSEVDEQLLVRFFMKEREDQMASQQEGRPIFKEREYIEIRVPGNRDVQACRPATFADKQRFPRHYEAFKRRTDAPVTGTPLSEWPQMSRSQAEELSFLNIKTVEQLAELNDTHAGKLHGGHNLKRQAAEWLKNADKSKLLAEKEALERRVEALESVLEEFKKTAELPKAEPMPHTALDEEPPAEEAPPPARRSRRKKAQ